MTFSIKTDRRLIRAGASSARYVLASFTAPEAPRRGERMAVNIALILDRSGSMAGARKFELARQAVEEAMRMLRPEDRFALIVYDSEVNVLTRSAPATPDAKRRALEALRDIEPRSMTDLFEGWMRGCAEIADHLHEEGIARALLLTDGLANRGTTDPATLIRHAGELRQRGIATSTFGVGEDFDERLLRDMAHEGGGNFYFIETPVQIPDLLTSELGEALEVVARHASLEVGLPRGARAEVLNRFRFSLAPGGSTLRIELGDLVSGQQVRVVVRVQFATGDVGETPDVRFALHADDIRAERMEESMSWTYAPHRANDGQERETDVDREVGILYAAKARAEATEANRHGDYDRARRVLERTAERISSYAGRDPVLRELVRELRAQVPQFAEAVMSPMMLKSAMYAAEATGKGRDPAGKARRAR